MQCFDAISREHLSGIVTLAPQSKPPKSATALEAVLELYSLRVRYSATIDPVPSPIKPDRPLQNLPFEAQGKPGGNLLRSSSKKLKMKLTLFAAAACSVPGAFNTAKRLPSGYRSKL